MHDFRMCYYLVSLQGQFSWLGQIAYMRMVNSCSYIFSFKKDPKTSINNYGHCIFKKIKIEFEPSEEFQCYKTTGFILQYKFNKNREKNTNK